MGQTRVFGLKVWLCGRVFVSTLGISLMLGGGAIALLPTPAAANLVQQRFELQRRPDDTYLTFLRRAEAVASTAIQRHFERDLAPQGQAQRASDEIMVMVLGKNNGTVVPLLRVRVTRQNWRLLPEAEPWTTYFPTAKILLGFPERSDTPGGEDPEMPPAPPPESQPTDTFPPEPNVG
jgi:hypothetical protein